MPSPVAIITGASRGIGLATARELSTAGYRLILVSRSPGESLPDSIAVPADVSRLADVERVVSTAMNTFGRVDAMINNAGLAIMKPIEQFTPEDWTSTLDTNLSAPYHFCRLLWPIWRQQKGGVVVNVSSMAARDPFPGFAAYGAAKAGLNLLGHALAREGADLNIRVHTIAPAATETPMFRSLFTREQYSEEKTLAPQDVAKIIVQCIRGDLQYTSGQVIYIQKTL